MKYAVILTILFGTLFLWFGGRSATVVDHEVNRDQVVVRNQPGRSLQLQDQPEVTKPEPVAGLSTESRQAIVRPSLSSKKPVELERLVLGQDLPPSVKTAIMNRLPPLLRKNFLSRKAVQIQARKGELSVDFSSLVSDCNDWRDVPDHTIFRISQEGFITEAKTLGSEGTIPDFIYSCRFEPYRVGQQAVPIVTYFTAARARANPEKRQAFQDFEAKMLEQRERVRQANRERTEVLCRQSPDLCNEFIKRRN
jgi:hypothetical protein